MEQSDLDWTECRLTYARVQHFRVASFASSGFRFQSSQIRQLVNILPDRGSATVYGTLGNCNRYPRPSPLRDEVFLFRPLKQSTTLESRFPAGPLHDELVWPL